MGIVAQPGCSYPPGAGCSQGHDLGRGASVGSGRTVVGLARSRLVIDEDGPRELSGLVVPLLGSLEATGDLFQPYRLVGHDGGGVGSAAASFAELTARGAAGDDAAFVWDGSAALVPVLVGARVDWDQATRVEARDFVDWLQVTVKPTRLHWRYPAGGAPASATEPAAARVNAVTGKPSRGDRNEAATVANCESVLRAFTTSTWRWGRGRCSTCSRCLGTAGPDGRRRTTIRWSRSPGSAAAGTGRRSSRAPRCIPDERFDALFEQPG